MNIFIIPGYHMPIDFRSDSKYTKYLNYVIKTLKDFSEQMPSSEILIIFSGGNIDMDPPYNRVLSVELKKLFLQMVRNKPKNWLLKTEEKSLSSLENLVFSKNIIDKQFHGKNNIFVFTEKRRSSRNKIIASLIFKKVYILPVTIEADHLEMKSKSVVLMKEKLAIKYSKWALQSDENFKKYHDIFEDKFRILRTVPPEKRKEEEIKWWKNGKSLIEKDS